MFKCICCLHLSSHYLHYCNHFFVIDTHKASNKVGENSNGVITSTSYCGQQLPNIGKELARLVRKEITSSVSQPAPQSLLEVDLQREVVQVEVSDHEDRLQELGS